MRTASIAGTRLREDPLWVVFKLNELMSPRGRRWLARACAVLATITRPFAGEGARPLELFARWVRGDRDAVARELHAAVPAASGRRLAGLCRLAVHVDEPELVLEHLEGDVPRSMRPVLVRAAVRAGRYGDAVALGERWPDDDLGTGVRDARERLELLATRVPAPWSGAAAGHRGSGVLHLLNNSLPWVQAGYTVRSQHVAEALATAGLQPLMVTRVGFPTTHGVVGAPRDHLVDGVRYVHQPAAPSSRLDRHVRQIAELEGLVASHRPAAIMSTTPHETGLPAAVVARRCGLPFVYEMRGFLEATWLARRGPGGECSDHYTLSRAAEGRLAAAADHVVTLGSAMRDDLVSRGVAPDKITIVPNAIDVDRFRPRGDGASVRERLGIPAGRPIMGYVGSLVPYEGLHLLVEAARRLRAMGTDVDVLVVGDGVARADLERTAARMGMSDRLHLPGRVPHDRVVGFYEAIDVFVTPRLDLPVCRLVTPLKPVEAMAVERPVVVSDLPALQDILADGAGRSFPAGDVDRLADVVQELLDHPQERRDLGVAARAGVLATRTWDTNALRYRELFAGLGVASARTV